MRFHVPLYAVAILILASCSSTRRSAKAPAASNTVQVSVDLVNVTNDQVSVTVIPPAMNASTVTYQLAKIIPGTYAIADYGRYVTDFRAEDKSGKTLPVNRTDSNIWVISQANSLAKLTYRVNDTYDNEGADVFSETSTTIFSPAGTNILAGQNFLLNFAGFAGYFTGYKDIPYNVTISHPQTLQAVTSMDDRNASNTADVFTVTRYAELVDHPVMYAAPDISTTKVGNMDLMLGVYSPRKKSITSKAFFPELERMIRAQKAYLGDINNTKKYAVIVYISTGAKDDAKGFGALEHNTSTTSVFGETMRSKELIHVISHEFFHTLTPLNVHSREIQDFDFNDPKMSAHLWMYEGFTEYFANHFQVHQGLMTEDAFYAHMTEKENFAKQMYKDDLSFTEMSKNVLQPAMKAQYPNVYQKGALIAMCLDIMLREASGGKTGILHLMGELSKKYGPEKPFNDPDLIPEVTRMTNAEVGNFLQTHVVGNKPIDYEQYLRRVGVTRAMVKTPTPIIFLANGRPYMSVDTAKRLVTLRVPDNKNAFYNAMGFKEGDQLLEMNEIPVDASDINKVAMLGYGIEEGEEMTAKVRRDGQVVELKGKAVLNYMDAPGFKFTDESKKALKDAWLKH